MSADLWLPPTSITQDILLNIFISTQPCANMARLVGGITCKYGPQHAMASFHFSPDEVHDIVVNECSSKGPLGPAGRPGQAVKKFMQELHRCCAFCEVQGLVYHKLQGNKA